MSEESDDEGLGCIGFMFDAQRSKAVQSFAFGDVSVSVLAIADDPGHVQSGQYLWPAAQALAAYVGTKHDLLHNSSVIIELGAGCGLAGITASKVLYRTSTIYLTDYDPGSLALLDENIALNGASDNVRSLSLTWGAELPHVLQQSLVAATSPPLILGSDLIYCQSVVRPLFLTVAECLKAGGVFVLVSSFDIGVEANEAVRQCCQAHNIAVEEISHLNVSTRVCRIQHFTRNIATI